MFEAQQWKAAQKYEKHGFFLKVVITLYF